MNEHINNKLVSFKDKIKEIRKDFPILDIRLDNKPLVYFDNAATTQKPQQVLNAVANYYNTTNSNVHRGVHRLSNQATTLFEEARKTVAEFINAGEAEEIIFTRGTTESINLVAWSFCEPFLNQGDEIIVSELDHHSNFVPWQMACKRKKATLKFIPILPSGQLDLNKFEELLSDKTKIVAVSHVSNTLGTINDIESIIELSHRRNIPVFIDGAQSAPHLKIDVKKLDCDFYAFSGHKMYAPMGIGVLYGKKEILQKLVPYQFGGEMVETVGFDDTTFNQLPYKFEAGTPNVGGAVGLEAAIKYINSIDRDFIFEYENLLKDYTSKRLNQIEDLDLLANVENKVGVFSFNVKNQHNYDVGVLLDNFGICVRTGTHCTQPLMQKLNILGTVRASLSFYNTVEEVDFFIESLKKVISILK
ncbi:MAG: aminotransferase class V-fold PLP-dependent enzyme [Bacteroidales bacterium]|jgi:cysteine desulfurase/selenocysteine lyase